jgi:sporulation protein YlmC with PRC-barrel domain
MRDATVRKIGVLVLLLTVATPILGACAGGSPAVALSPPAPDVRSVQLVGYEVHNSVGQWLGEVAGVLLDPETGDIAYVVLSYREPHVYGRAVMVVNPQRFLPIPWALFTPGPEAGTLGIKADETSLIPAPYLEQAPDSLSVKQAQAIDEFWRSANDERTHADFESAPE